MATNSLGQEVSDRRFGSTAGWRWAGRKCVWEDSSQIGREEVRGNKLTKHNIVSRARTRQSRTAATTKSCSGCFIM
eukprot:scaffold24523_cov46-Cyclotella_meneghiniana.AAC.4